MPHGRATLPVAPGTDAADPHRSSRLHPDRSHVASRRLSPRRVRPRRPRRRADPALRHDGGSGRPRPDARPDLREPDGVRGALRQARGYRARSEAGAAARHLLGAVARREGADHAPAPGCPVPRRREARRRGGQVLDRAPHEDAGLAAPLGDRTDRLGGRRRRPDLPDQPEAAVRAAAGAVHRPGRHDGLAQGRRTARRQVRHRAGLRRTVQVRGAGAAGPDRGRALPRLLEQGRDPHPAGRVPADPRCHRAAHQPARRAARPA